MDDGLVEVDWAAVAADLAVAGFSETVGLMGYTERLENGTDGSGQLPTGP